MYNGLKLDVQFLRNQFVVFIVLEDPLFIFLEYNTVCNTAFRYILIGKRSFQQMSILF